ncbi:undecaprenyldiphospho-muramoylpentapeptide beta-N-acetylglucosaminyltransferase [Campylobacter sputorum]|uniref:undecaprenyldiphospho-muramoylpentapeptide beta-N-acetylglucosaminyltransferase n=1 Tax=Campylobacter sputorum TaxID=206 RepID=UPI00053BD923|nr:undecaprenyldiphospho-muramoylpentapeptide beta-N-acetylglucosaminyltransferase [Campylobacter sputorum]
MIAISGGGTGGHLIIAKTLCEELNKRGEKTIFIGSQNGQDKLWFENDDDFTHKYFLQSSGIVNKKGLSKLISFLNIIKLSFVCIKIFKKHGIKKIVCVGGYSAAPASFAGILTKKEIYIHEQNAVTGKLNKFIKKFAKNFFSSYEGKFYSYPVNLKFFESARVRNGLKAIMFLGGSQGAKFINSLALELALSLKEKNIKIIHQCGLREFDEIKQKYKELGVEAEVFAFSKNIEESMKKADLCISRAGASSLWELCANNLPCIFIPFPFAAKNHQFYNAKFLYEKNLCVLIEQKNVDKNTILRYIDNINLAEISSGLANVIEKNGAKIIVDEILA